MSIDRFTLEKVRSVSLLDVAAKLRLELIHKGSGQWYKTRCFIHDDHSPSLGLRPATGRWRCFACQAKGDVIGLVMEHEQLDFEAACRWICKEFHIDPDGHTGNRFSLLQFIRSKCMDMTHTQYLDPELVKRFEGTHNAFTRAMVQTGFLTAEQMARAAVRFRLSSAGEQVVFWMIDAEGRLREGKVMAYTADGTVATRSLVTGVNFKRIDTLIAGGSSTGGSSTGGIDNGSGSGGNDNGGGSGSDSGSGSDTGSGGME